MIKVLLRTNFLTIVFLIGNLFFASLAFDQTAITFQVDYPPDTTTYFRGFASILY